MEECKHQHKDFILIRGEKYEFCIYCGELLDKAKQDESKTQKNQSHI